MKVLLINTYDKGGAANACIRLHEGLLAQGVDSTLLLKEKSKNVPNSFLFKPRLNFKSKLRNRLDILGQLLLQLVPLKLQKKFAQSDSFLQRRDSRLEYFSYPTSACDITTSSFYKEADIINLHWVAGFLDYKSFFKNNTKPIIWTLHDMGPFLGGQHYDESIIGMSKKGIPLLRKRTLLEVNQYAKILSAKQKWLEGVENVTLVAPSKWLAAEVRNSLLFSKYPVYHIPYGLNPDNFKNYKLQTAREVFGLPLDKKVLVFVAESVSNPRKGWEFLRYALKNIRNRNVLVCTVGYAPIQPLEGIDVRYLGYMADYRMLSLCYSAADAFVIPSLMDNLPNTVLESLMCGTPVIGFPVGGILDMVEHHKNGVLAEEISGESLKIAIEEFLNNTAEYDRESIRTSAIALYDSKIQAERYNSLFKSTYNKS